jgi:hypothetical protein
VILDGIATAMGVVMVVYASYIGVWARPRRERLTHRKRVGLYAMIGLADVCGVLIVVLAVHALAK